MWTVNSADEAQNLGQHIWRGQGPGEENAGTWAEWPSDSYRSTSTPLAQSMKNLSFALFVQQAQLELGLSNFLPQDAKAVIAFQPVNKNFYPQNNRHVSKVSMWTYCRMTSLIGWFVWSVSIWENLFSQVKFFFLLSLESWSSSKNAPPRFSGWDEEV